jgi:hypothetical protein
MAGILEYKQSACSWRRHVYVAVEERYESEITSDRTLQKEHHTRKTLQTETEDSR